MSTRHPLTIPAALVLGTAIAATALPLPRFAPATTSFIDEAGVWIVKMVDVSGLQLGSLCSKLEQVCRHH